MIYLKTPDAELIYTYDWSDALPPEVTLVSVANVVPSPLVLISHDFAADEALSSVEIGGGAHGGLYVISANATLSNGETVPSSFTLRVFEGS